MARIIVKARYLKPTRKQTPGGYARYVATRDGVAKIDDSHKSSDISSRDTTYADYIATRPGVEKNGTHGLFTDAGIPVDLGRVSDELNDFKGTVWTVIVSVRREDAGMVGFDTGERWRDMVRANRNELAKSFKIRPHALQWYGAFHDESYHPHIHLIIYDKENRGYLSKAGIEDLKSTFAHCIFRDEMLNIQNEKTLRRDLLRQRGKDEIEEILSHIQDGTEENLALKLLLIDFGQRLKDHKGKKVYGYLSRQDRALVDSIVDEIEKLPAVSSLYGLWYEKQNELRHIYSETDLPRLPLSANPEFKSIRNAVIKAAAGLSDQDIHSAFHKEPSPERVTGAVTGLLNSISRLFEDKFNDNPEHIPKVDIKLRRQILEKDEAHGIKHG